jgi:hypothetical protein
MELLWDSPAAAGHNRKTVFRAALASEGDRKTARALDAVVAPEFKHRDLNLDER